MTVYLSLFFISFLAATLVPTSSELILIGLITTNNYNPVLLLASASFGNILGSAVNWILGFYFYKLINNKWIPFNPKQVDAASQRFRKFGIWSLLFAWLPIVGDPLTFIAGILKINFILFLALVSTGKIIRYVFIYFFINM
jgi:membrane protein YqaA with SNARE-associated domain